MQGAQEFDGEKEARGLWAKNKTLQITVSEETAFYMNFLIEDENLIYPRVLIERLVNQAIKKRRVEDRPVYKIEGGSEK